ncbi:IS1 family transposase, partial [Escherichia coli]|uniref:IS1 family transposase n=1 Tax=Escherichia coli TaxID=562 RepID=UPI001FCDEDDF
NSQPFKAQCQIKSRLIHIKRNNLTLRTRIKWLACKTICFSRSVEIHEKVIGSFIEKHMFC